MLDELFATFRRAKGHHLSVELLATAAGVMPDGFLIELVFFFDLVCREVAAL